MLMLLGSVAAAAALAPAVACTSTTTTTAAAAVAHFIAPNGGNGAGSAATGLGDRIIAIFR